jgi:L-amino acid N-acyltransferase YncA
MFDQIVRVSEALRQSAGQMQGLRMAMKGCPECGMRHMIAAPSLGNCVDCGSALKVLKD